MIDSSASALPMPALLRREGLGDVEGAFAYRGGHDMTVPNLGHRQRWCLRVKDADGQTRLLFMKRYEREPLRWRLQRLWTYGWRKSPAGVELDNVHAACAAGVATIEQAVCGQEFDLLGARRSYIVLSAVPGEALEQCVEDYLASCAGSPEAMADFTRRLAELVGRFHRAGYVHRDLYTSHVFLSRGAEGIELRLIDLARMFRPRWRGFRWRVKDLAQLKYSMPPQWLTTEWETFLGLYLGEQGRHEMGRYARAIDAKAASIGRHVERKRRAKERGSREGRL